MENLEDYFANLIEARLGELGESAFSFEQKKGWPADTLRSVIRKDKKRARPNLARVKMICDGMGLEIYIGPHRDVPAVVSPGALEDFVEVPVHEAFLAAGHGAVNGDEQQVSTTLFSRKLLRELGVPPSVAIMAKVSGTSMRPTIFPGDNVLIDTSRRTVEVRTVKTLNTRKNRPPIYAFVEDGHARVKRMIGNAEKGVQVLSDNPNILPQYLSPEDLERLHIIGRVVWWGHNDP